MKCRYGVKNVFQRPDILVANAAKLRVGGTSNAKRLNTLQRKYGIRTPFARLDVRHKIIRAFLGGAKGRYISNLNRRAYAVLERHAMQYEAEFMISRLSYDLRFENVLIELNGDHPHANPVKFAANDVVLMPGQRYTAAEIWARDALKAELAREHGFKFVCLWESDLNVDFERVLLEALR